MTEGKGTFVKYLLSYSLLEDLPKLSQLFLITTTGGGGKHAYFRDERNSGSGKLDNSLKVTQPGSGRAAN